MWRPTIQGLLAHKLRLALTALAIVLGVTFVSGTLVLTDTLHNTFTTLFGHVYENVDFQVRGVAAFGTNGGAVRKPIPQSLVAEVRAVPGVAVADGSVSGYAQFVAHDGKAITTGGAPTLGLSFDPDARLSSLHVAEGAAPSSPDEVVMDAGDRPQVPLHGGRPGPDPARRAAPDLHDRRHRRVRDGQQPGRGDARRLRPAHGAGLRRGGPPRRHRRRDHAGRRQGRGAAGDRHGPAPRVQVVTGQTVANEQTNADQPGAVASSPPRCWSSPSSHCSWADSPSSTPSRSSSGQRTRELALLRIVGASRRQVFRSVLGEAAIIGPVASLVGLGLGVLAALGLEALLRGLRDHPAPRARWSSSPAPWWSPWSSASG